MYPDDVMAYGAYGACGPAYGDPYEYCTAAGAFRERPQLQYPPSLPLPSGVLPTGVKYNGGLQKSTAVVPGTAEEWDEHRDLITRLYRDMNLPLREVQKMMEEDYKFKATRRMFNIRLKRWNLCKNLRANEKEELAARIAKAHIENRSLDSITHNNRPVKFHRVLRHCKVVARQRKREGQRQQEQEQHKASSQDSSDDCNSNPNSDRVHDTQSTMVRVLAAAAAAPGENMTRRKTPGSDMTCKTTRSESSSSGVVLVTPDSGNTSATVLTPAGSSDNEVVPYINGSQPIQSHPLSHPEPPIFPPKWGTMNVDFILNQTQTYYLAHLETIRFEATEIYNVMTTSNLFWSNVKSAIYFLKMKTPALAWPLLNEACGLVGDILGNNVPILFLNSVFSVLSPVNTRICPLARSTLLRYLSQMASIKLTPHHPLTILFRETAQEDEFGLTSETALLLTLNLLRHHLGVDHTGTFTVHRSLINLLRRDGRLEEAKKQSEELVRTTEQASTSQVGLLAGAVRDKKPTSISLTELCIAMTELVHIYIDMRDYVVAEDICDKVIQNYRTIQGPNFPDSRAAYAMEDMAQLCEELGDEVGAAYWLRQAMEASCMLRGESDAATKHVKDKLEELIKKLEIS